MDDAVPWFGRVPWHAMEWRIKNPVAACLFPAVAPAGRTGGRAPGAGDARDPPSNRGNMARGTLRTTPRRANRPVGDEEAATRKMGAMGTGGVSVNARLNLEAVERTLAALSGGKENDALGLDTVLVKGLHDIAIDEGARGEEGIGGRGQGIHNRKGPTVSVPDAVKTPPRSAPSWPRLSPESPLEAEQDRLRDELERREGAVPGKPPSSPFTPPPPPVNTPVGLASRSLTCGDTNESADADASPFAMTPRSSPRLRDSRCATSGPGGPSNPLGRALAAGERGEPLTSAEEHPGRRGGSGRGRSRGSAARLLGGRRRMTTSSPS